MGIYDDGDGPLAVRVQEQEQWACLHVLLWSLPPSSSPADGLSRRRLRKTSECNTNNVGGQGHGSTVWGHAPSLIHQGYVKFGLGQHLARCMKFTSSEAILLLLEYNLVNCGIRTKVRSTQTATASLHSLIWHPL